MTHPLPVGIASLVVPLLAVALFLFCTRWLVRSFHPRVRCQRTWLFTAAFLIGLFLAFHYAFHRYQYNADWQMVGVPIPAVYLERTIWPNGTVFWKDWVGLQMPVGFLGNIAFWVSLPYAPIALFAWFFQQRQPASTPST